MFMQEVLMSAGQRTDLIGVLQSLGLTTNLKIALDAADQTSYVSGQTWLDMSGQGTDFFLGVDGSATATDPTFNAKAVAGAMDLRGWFGLDGGDNLRYDSAIETWMDALHKDNAVFTICMWVYLGAGGAATGLFGTRGSTTTGNGMLFALTAADVLQFMVGNGTAEPLTIVSTAVVPIGEWAFVAIGLNEATGANGADLVINGTAESKTSTYSSPASGTAAFNLEIGALGNGVSRMPAGSRIAMVVAWGGTRLTAAEINSIYLATKERFDPTPGSFAAAIKSLGLDGSLKSCFDAGDIQSYRANDQIIEDTSPLRFHDFYVGADGSVTATDPTFHGVAGALTGEEYFTLDGGDFFRLAAAANPTWVQNLHKNNAKFTAAFWVYFNTSTGVISLFGTRGVATANTGMMIYKGAGVQNMALQVQNAGASAFGGGTGFGTVANGRWNFVMMSMDEANSLIRWLTNWSYEIYSASYSSPSSGNASFLAEVGASGNGVTPFESGGRIAVAAMWEGSALSNVAMWDLYLATFQRFRPDTPTTLYDVLQSQSLLTGCKLCIDAGDAACYGSAAAFITDRSAYGLNINRGSTYLASSEPTFRGSYGGKSYKEYFSFDGADCFQAASDTFFRQLHYDGARFTLCGWFFVDRKSAFQGLWGTGGDTNTHHGFRAVLYNDGTVELVVMRNNATPTLNPRSTPLEYNYGWNFIAISLDEPAATGFFYINGGTDNFVSTYVSPTAVQSDYPLEICSSGAATDKVVSNTRFSMSAAFDTSLSSGQLDAIYNATKGRYGIL